MSRFRYSDYPVIVGIDFGTTFSGCSYAIETNQKVVDIVHWPKRNNQVYPKTPTLALYDKETRRVVDWGHSARLRANRPGMDNMWLLSKFKLHLDEQVKHEPLPCGLSLTNVIADYLHLLHKHVCSEIFQSTCALYSLDQFRYCLTVPATWSDHAKSTMRESMIRAGIIQRTDHPDRLTLISEPEAAALYCEKKSEQFNLHHGQRFMICDAGGGTVDLIVFEIHQPSHDMRRALREVSHGHGGSCGSAFLDMNMRSYMLKKFFHHGAVSETALNLIMETFVNHIKPEFDGNEDQFVTLPASMGLARATDPNIGLNDGMITLPADELRFYVFEPVVLQILALIEDQLRQATYIEAIFLVGGFGQSNYLFRRVEEVFGHRIGMIGVPPRGELAVVRGAVYSGLYPTAVTERVVRRTYGVETRMPFRQGIDPEDHAIVGLDGKKFCRRRFNVYVRKGQHVKVDECISKVYIVNYPNDTDSDLYAYDEDGPPPETTSHPKVRKVGFFPVQMPVLEGVIPGDKIEMIIRMFFGLTEIRVECMILDQAYVFTSSYDASDVHAPFLPQKDQASHLSYTGASYPFLDGAYHPQHVPYY